MDISSVNAQIRTLLGVAEVQMPGARSRAERVAVYAVAVGERLGMTTDQLISLRLAAELSDVGDVTPALAALMATDHFSLSITGVCRTYDNLRTGAAGNQPLTDAECVRWLETEAILQFDENIVAALSAVQSLIQAVGT